MALTTWSFTTCTARKGRSWHALQGLEMTPAALDDLSRATGSMSAPPPPPPPSLTSQVQAIPPAESGPSTAPSIVGGHLPAGQQVQAAPQAPSPARSYNPRDPRTRAAAAGLQQPVPGISLPGTFPLPWLETMNASKRLKQWCAGNACKGLTTIIIVMT